MGQTAIRPNAILGNNSPARNDARTNTANRKTAIPYDPRTSRRARASSSRALLRISSSDILIGSVGWLCQTFFGSFMGYSFGTAPSLIEPVALMEPAAQDSLDPVNLHRDVRR